MLPAPCDILGLVASGGLIFTPRTPPAGGALFAGIGPMFSFSSPNSFHSSISSKSCHGVSSLSLSCHTLQSHAHTPITKPSFTNPGSFFLAALRCHNLRAFSSVAVSIAWNGILLALRIVSSLDVAVMICDEPAVNDVNRNSLGSFSYSDKSCAMIDTPRVRLLDYCDWKDCWQ